MNGTGGSLCGLAEESDAPLSHFIDRLPWFFWCGDGNSLCTILWHADSNGRAGEEMLKIANGTVYDPRNGVSGEVRDVWIDGGRVVATPAKSKQRASRTIDARGMIVMPGGVDMHCHIAGAKVNTARKMMPDNKRAAQPIRRTEMTRAGTTGAVPSTFATGYLYAGLGYTTAFDAAIPPLAARYAHEELH